MKFNVFANDIKKGNQQQQPPPPANSTAMVFDLYLSAQAFYRLSRKTPAIHLYV